MCTLLLIVQGTENEIEILVGQAVLDQNSQYNVLINNLRTAWPTL